MMPKLALLNPSCEPSLLTVASHDLRQTVNAIMLCINAMEEVGLNDKQEKIIKTLRDSAHAMERTLDALLKITNH